MKDLAVACACVGLVVALLGIEALALHVLRMSVAARIAVIGTRGKSSVARLIAAGLRHGGRRAMFKTTGSRASIGLPDGRERDVRRRSLPTPLEQRRVLLEARRLGADAVVLEGMSIRPENLRVELQRIISPQHVVLTNVRPDHLSDLPDPVGAFARAVPRRASVVCPSDVPPELVRRLRERGITVHLVSPIAGKRGVAILPYEERPENLALALELCRQLGVSEESALEGMRSVNPDVGVLSAWRIQLPVGAWTCVSAFAANEPESTALLLERARGLWGTPDGACVGLLNLREDRGDRTDQWVRSLVGSGWPFDRLIVVGAVPWSVRHRLRRSFGERLHVSRSPDPEGILAELAAGEAREGLLFGFGNMGGAGARFLSLWQERGVPA